ncbi:MAG: GNAT family N-acetyltransferase [Odoribacter sp.]|nr:GNAT family N-acetyltransferase [Odoribacter sp.]
MDVIAPRLITERLILEEIAEKDTERIAAWRSNPDVYRFFLSPHPLSAKEHRNWFQNQYIWDRNRLDWMAVRKDNKEAVGIFGIKRQEEGSAEAEISYLLEPTEHGQGYAREAVDCIMEFASKSWHCNSCIAVIHMDNCDSVKFAVRLGFVAIDTYGSFVRYKREL